MFAPPLVALTKVPWPGSRIMSFSALRKPKALRTVAPTSFGAWPAFTASFSSFVLRFFGTGAIVASNIWPPRAVAFGFKVVTETLKQLLDQSSFGEPLAEQPQGRAVGIAVLEPEPRNRVNDRRSRTWNSTCSLDRL
jgi:hypothetical protein